MEPVPAKKIERFTMLAITCGKCKGIFHRRIGKETQICSYCQTLNNLATTWNERKDNE